MSITQGKASAEASSRRSKIGVLVAAVIVLLPGLIAFVLYSRHQHNAHPAANENVAERDKMAVAADQRLMLSGNLEQAAKEYQQIVARYPQDSRAYDELGVVYARLGQYTAAVEAGKQALALDPDALAPYEHAPYYDLALQHPEDAHQRISQAQAKKMDSAAFHKVLYAIAFLTQSGPDRPAMSDQVRWFAGRPDFESYGLALASNTAAYSGHVEQSLDLASRAVESAIGAGNKDLAAAWQENAALRQAAFGNFAEARKQAEVALKLAPASPDIEVEAALALAMVGDAARADALAQDVNKRLPNSTQMQSVWLPTIRAELAIQRKNAREAVDDLAPALPLELGETGLGPNPTCMYSTYIRGQAYLALDKGTAAATEFQKILDHSGVVWNCWTGALAHLGMGRAHLLDAQDFEGQDAEGARVKAVMAYKDFFKLWKDADPDNALLEQAKKEYAAIPQ